MQLFLSILLTAGFGYWFYRTSERLGAKSPQWAVAGAISYQIPAWIWMLMVTKPYLSELRGASKTTFMAGLMGNSWILVGIVVALLVYKFFLLKTNVKA